MQLEHNENMQILQILFGHSEENIYLLTLQWLFQGNDIVKPDSCATG